VTRRRRARSAIPFDRLTEVVDRFLEQRHIARYALYLQDYGGRSGFVWPSRIPERPDRADHQNAVAHERGLSDLWGRAEPLGRSATHEAAVRANLLSLEATRQRHVGRSPGTRSVSIPKPGRASTRF